MKLKTILNSILEEYDPRVYEKTGDPKLDNFIEDLKKGVKFENPVKFLVNDVKAYFVEYMKINKPTLSQFNITIKTKSGRTLNFRIKKYRIGIFFSNLKEKYKVVE
jgi:ABC-type transport system substrate-binding protein